MAFEREKEDFDKSGFVIIRELLQRSDFEQLSRNIDRYIRDVVPGLGSGDAFYQDPTRPETLKQLHRMDSDPFFEQYKQHPRWGELAEALVGEAVVTESPEWFNKPPRTNHVTPPHQDNYYFCLAPANVITVWLALDDVDAENGCLRYVQGSHLCGYRPHGKSNILGFSQGVTDYSHNDFMLEVAACLKSGDAVVHHGMTIHRADANLSVTRHRRSFAMVFKGVSCQRDEFAFHRYSESARSQHQQAGLNV
jgi:phytanoyl-CoA hydroxylase